MDIGDRVQISNPPPWLPPGLIDQHMHGYTERLGLYEWTLAMNCAPAGPWQVGEVGSLDRGRIDTSGSELAAGVTSTDTVLPVTVTATAGQPWVSSLVHPDDFPFDVVVGGEVVTVTDIVGEVGDRFDRSVTDGWGTATSGQAWTTTGGRTPSTQCRRMTRG